MGSDDLPTARLTRTAHVKNTIKYTARISQTTGEINYMFVYPAIYVVCDVHAQLHTSHSTTHYCSTHDRLFQQHDRAVSAFRHVNFDIGPRVVAEPAVWARPRGRSNRRAVFHVEFWMPAEILIIPAVGYGQRGPWRGYDEI